MTTQNTYHICLGLSCMIAHTYMTNENTRALCFSCPRNPRSVVFSLFTCPPSPLVSPHTLTPLSPHPPRPPPPTPAPPHPHISLDPLAPHLRPPPITSHTDSTTHECSEAKNGPHCVGPCCFLRYTCVCPCCSLRYIFPTILVRT